MASAFRSLGLAVLATLIVAGALYASSQVAGHPLSLSVGSLSDLGVNILEALLVICVALIVRVLLFYVVDSAFASYPSDLVESIKYAVSLIVFSGALVIALSVLTHDPFVLIIAFAGIVVALILATRKLFEDLMVRLALLASTGINIGDQVTIGNDSGRVAEFAIFYTVLRRQDGTFVAIPNRKVLESNVINLARGRTGIKVSDFIDLPLSTDGAKVGQAVRKDLFAAGLKEPHVSWQRGETTGRLTVTVNVNAATDAAKAAKTISAALRKQSTAK